MLFNEKDGILPFLADDTLIGMMGDGNEDFEVCRPVTSCNPREISIYKRHARPDRVCRLGGVSYAQRRTSMPLSISDCCQGIVVPITGQCVMC